MAEARKVEMIDGVQNIIAYTFRDASILWEALQAPGAVPYGTQGRNFSNGNKRLALLGDAILKTVLLERWYATSDTIGENDHSESCDQHVADERRDRQRPRVHHRQQRQPSDDRSQPWCPAVHTQERFSGKSNLCRNHGSNSRGHPRRSLA